MTANQIFPTYVVISDTIPDIKSEEWINGDKNVEINNFYLFNKDENFDISYEYKIEKSDKENIVSTICFDKDCKVLTNYGYVKLCEVDIHKHTINDNKIVAVTKTIYHGYELIIMKKNSLGPRTPNKDTIMTKEHCILFKGKLIPANKFVGRYTTIKYDKRYVYNILLEEWSTMKVNNMNVETLNPKNITAQLYQTKEKMTEFIKAHNYAIFMSS